MAVSNRAERAHATREENHSWSVRGSAGEFRKDEALMWNMSCCEDCSAGCPETDLSWYLSSVVENHDPGYDLTLWEMDFEIRGWRLV